MLIYFLFLFLFIVLSVTPAGGSRYGENSHQWLGIERSAPPTGSSGEWDEGGDELLMRFLKIHMRV